MSNLLQNLDPETVITQVIELLMDNGLSSESKFEKIRSTLNINPSPEAEEALRDVMTSLDEVRKIKGKPGILDLNTLNKLRKRVLRLNELRQVTSAGSLPSMGGSQQSTPAGLEHKVKAPANSKSKISSVF